MEARLNIVTLGVADLPASRAFYETGLGWPAASASRESIAFFQLGGLVLALYPYELLAEDAMVTAAGHGFRGFTLAHNVRRKDEVAAVLAQAKKAGGQVAKAARDTAWGGHSGYFSDPDGYLWEVAWNPYFELNERGEIALA